MKTFFISLLCALIGFASGWIIKSVSEEAKIAEVGQEAIKQMESSDAAQAALAIRIIEFIDSEDAEKAVYFSASPIANYYSLYGTRTDERTKNLCTKIEQLAKTNQIVASRIAESTK